MKSDFEHKSIIVRDLSNGEEFPIFQFFKYSTFSQQSILEDYVMPILNRGSSVTVSIVDSSKVLVDFCELLDLNIN